MIQNSIVQNNNECYHLFENGLNIYSSNNINLVVHELLSTLLNYLKFLKNNNFDTILQKVYSPETTFDMYINITISDNNKRYPINLGNINFSLNDCNFNMNGKQYNFALNNYNYVLIEELKSYNKNNSQLVNNVQHNCNNEKKMSFSSSFQKNDSLNLLFDKSKQLSANSNLDDKPFIIVEKNDSAKSIELSDDFEKQMQSEIDKIKNLRQKHEDDLLKLKNKYNNIDTNTEVDNEVDNIVRDVESNILTKTDSPNDSVELEKIIKDEIEKLESFKQKQEDVLLKIKDKHINEKESLINYECEINAKKMMDRINLEKEKERRNIYQSDKKSYHLIKKHIMDGLIDEENISPFFKQKYPIFKFMDQNGDIDCENDYELYTELFSDLYGDKNNNSDDDDTEKCYVPHNYHYLTEEEKAKYESFIDKNKNKIPSYDELLMELNEIEKEEYINKCGVDPDNITKNDESSAQNNSLSEITNIFKSNLN